MVHALQWPDQGDASHRVVPVRVCLPASRNKHRPNLLKMLTRFITTAQTGYAEVPPRYLDWRLFQETSQQ
eukprot:3992086-Pleurochrysis_carterae.AAC.1